MDIEWDTDQHELMNRASLDEEMLAIPRDNSC